MRRKHLLKKKKRCNQNVERNTKNAVRPMPVTNCRKKKKINKEKV